MGFFAWRRVDERRWSTATVAIAVAVGVAVATLVATSSETKPTNRGHINAAVLAHARAAPLLAKRPSTGIIWWLLGTTHHDSVLVVAFESNGPTRLKGFWVHQTDRTVALGVQITGRNFPYAREASRGVGIATFDLHEALGDRKLIHA